MVLVDYPEDFIVYDERALPRTFKDDEERSLDIYGAAVVDKLKKIIQVKIGDIIDKKYEPLWKLVVEKYARADEQLAALFMAWVSIRFKEKKYDLDEIRRLLPRDAEVRRHLLLILKYLGDEEWRRYSAEKTRREYEKRLERLLSRYGFGIVVRAAEMYNAGKSWDEIKKRLGLKSLTDVKVILEYAEKLKLVTLRKKKYKTRGRLSRLEKEEIVRMYREGKTVYEIAKTLGRPVSTVNAFLKRIGLK